MSKDSITVTLDGLSRLWRSAARIHKELTVDVAGAVEMGAQQVAEGAYHRMRAPFNRRALWQNVQDGVDSRKRINVNRNMVQIRIDRAKAEAKVRVRAHYTSARTPAIHNVLGKLGRRGSLRRSRLLVLPPEVRITPRSHRGHQTSAGLQSVVFANSSSLRRWVAKMSENPKFFPRPEWAPDWADTTYLEGEALKQIVLSPSLAESEKSILARIRKAVERQGLRRAS